MNKINIRDLGNNKTELSTSKMVVLFSYNTPVACEIEGKYYRTSKKWSVTTSKHINQWLEGVKAELRDQEWFDNLL